MDSTAIKSLKRELTRMNRAISLCVTDNGFVKSHCRYRYQILVSKARVFKESIEYLEGLYKERGIVGQRDDDLDEYIVVSKEGGEE